MLCGDPFDTTNMGQYPFTVEHARSQEAKRGAIILRNYERRRERKKRSQVEDHSPDTPWRPRRSDSVPLSMERCSAGPLQSKRGTGMTRCVDVPSDLVNQIKLITTEGGAAVREARRALSEASSVANTADRCEGARA